MFVANPTRIYPIWLIPEYAMSLRYFVCAIAVIFPIDIVRIAKIATIMTRLE